MLDVARLIVGRLRNPDPQSARNRLKAVALLPAGADVPVVELAEKLSAATIEGVYKPTSAAAQFRFRKRKAHHRRAWRAISKSINPN
jgi:hypothetical protein